MLINFKFRTNVISKFSEKPHVVPDAKKLNFHFYVFLLLISLLPACQHLPEKKLPLITPQQQSRMELTHWLLLGKVGIQLKGRAARAEFLWTQQPNSYALNLQGPFGLGALQLINTPEEATLITPNGIQQGKNAETLIEQQLGWPLPINYFSWWLKGLPAPQSPPQNLKYDAQQRLIAFMQSGWTIQIENYQITTTENHSISTLELPYRVIFSKDLLRLTWVTSEWKNLNF